MSSMVSFLRGHGAGANASSSVGAAFIIGAVFVAVLGLRWVGASGADEDGGDDTPWNYAEAGNVNTSTTIPASTPAKVVPIPDPTPPEDGVTTTTRPGQKPGVFLPGYTPTPGGGTPPTTESPQSPTTSRGSVGTVPTIPTTTTTTTTTTAPPTTTTTTTTIPEETTTTTEDTTPPAADETSAAIDQAVEERISQRFAEMGWPLA
jgi:hypothetical protein